MAKTYPYYAIFECTEEDRVHPYRILETFNSIDGPCTRIVDGHWQTQDLAELHLFNRQDFIPDITREQLNNGLSALSIHTRELVIAELERAQRDTNVEYHRAVARSSQIKLLTEIQALNSLILSANAVQDEFKEISGG